MSNDKMREARNSLVRIEKYLSTQPAEYCGNMDNHFSAELASIEAALTQQPESELKGTVGNCYGPDNRGLYRIAVFSGSHFPVGTTVYASPQPSAQVPDGRADEIVTQLYRRFKDWSRRGFGPDDVTWCEVKADVMALIDAAPSTAEKESNDE